MIFSYCLCCCHIVHRNHIFRLYQKDKSSDSKLKFRQAIVIVAERFLELPNLHMLIKQKSSLLPRNLVLKTFGELLIVFPTKVNLLCLLYSTAQRCCLLHLKAKLFAENFSKKSNLDGSGISLLFFLLELI